MSARCALHPAFEADYCPSCGTARVIGSTPTVTDAEVAEFRAEAAHTFDTVATELLRLLRRWPLGTQPLDIDEYPFSQSLDEQIAEIQEAAALIRQETGR